MLEESSKRRREALERVISGSSVPSSYRSFLSKTSGGFTASDRERHPRPTISEQRFSESFRKTSRGSLPDISSKESGPSDRMRELMRIQEDVRRMGSKDSSYEYYHQRRYDDQRASSPVYSQGSSNLSSY
ncbi:hypothetical protein BSKO_00803 [Bryopsis sp. KO-2023]|nr:hypothetical protein BSKO_00803 [Bryopsis sp. KO-2023]